MTVLASKATAIRDIIVELGIERDKAIRILDGGSSLCHRFDIDADDFLQQAEDDFELQGNSALLNAVSNAKRAIHAQVDEVLNALGYNTKGRSFDKRLALFCELGFVAPRILKRINDARNILEHEYTTPTLNQVQEAIDLATLFVGATKRHTVLWKTNISIGNEGLQVDDRTFSRELILRFDHDNKMFHIIGEIDVLPFEEWYRDYEHRKRSTIIGEVNLSAGEPLFAEFVRLVVAGDRERKSCQALDRLFDRVQL
jgi:hypothetical protein